MKLTNEQLEKLQKQCLEATPFLILPEVKLEKGKEKEAEKATKENEDRAMLFDTMRKALPALVDELLSKRHKLNE